MMVTIISIILRDFHTPLWLCFVKERKPTNNKQIFEHTVDIKINEFNFLHLLTFCFAFGFI